MGKNLSYRDKLLELSKIYKISEIQNYIRNKKNLTTSQIEHILKKNKVPVPKNFNVGFFERNISKPFSKAGKEVTDIYDDTTSGVNRFFSRLRRGIENTGEQTTSGIGRFFINIWKSLGNLGIGILETFPKLFVTLFNFFGNIFVNTFNNIYNSNATEKKGSQVITIVAIITIFTAVGLIGYNSFDKFKEFATKPSKTITEKKIETKKESSNLKKVEKDKNVKKQPKAKEKILKKEKNPSQVKELVLPNLNLKTETVLSLFDDVEYDLKIVRSKKIVKPIYFTQFPKDLDEIKDVKLKKETFIKIVLPLVVAENEKILNDRIKLKKILTRRITSDKEKLWLRQKLREYKVKKSDMGELEKRMDIIPVSIALAQAAKESGWGTSRFALEGNAIFGQWTWTGQGIEPMNKEKNKDHKILRFPILRASVKAYKNNLNTHKGYAEFREKRFKLRKRNRSVRGLDLTKTLDRYAQTGKEYTEILEQIIKQNYLSDFEAVQLTNSIVKKEFNL
tara:strand:- start:6179 stop:7699 length:1521 start_codon:yes stop_codon:yes gene_type:complete